MVENKGKVTQMEVDAVQWFHSVDLGDGVVSKGCKPINVLQKEAEAVFKYGVAGKSVLDIGAWDGSFSFAAEERNARDVLATDYFCWCGPGWGKKVAFELARKGRGSKVRDLVIDIPELSIERVGKFDIVLFLGVLYHLKNPLLALEQIAPLVTEMLILDTETSLDTMDEPVMRFFPGSELNNDPTNWWAPNIVCIKAMLKVAGFKQVECTPHPEYNGQINAQRGRFIFHAFK
jgi:tRNA (mo5U34)-methyltransferase